LVHYKTKRFDAEFGGSINLQKILLQKCYPKLWKDGVFGTFK